MSGYEFQGMIYEKRIIIILSRKPHDLSVLPACTKIVNSAWLPNQSNLFKNYSNDAVLFLGTCTENFKHQMSFILENFS